jgi:23S rRNA pseudouridine1911/1915/1917 synthase
MNSDQLIKINSHSNLKERIDVFLSMELSKLSIEYSRSKIQKLINSGNILLNDVVLKSASSNVQIGQYIIQPLKEEHDIKPFDFILDIVFEDEDLAVVNKPAGLTVHPAHDYHHDTLVNALVKHFGDNLSSINGFYKPGIVHRLDRDTSGLMVVAKNDTSHVKLSKQLEERTLSRLYHAICFGVPKKDSDIISTKIDRMRNDRTKMIVSKVSGRDAVTLYEVKEHYGNHASMIACRLKTGRTHQIRVHLNHICHSIIGDPFYGHNKRKILELEKIIGHKININRQALHSSSISFVHPRTLETMSFDSPFPADINDLIKLLTLE